MPIYPYVCTACQHRWDERRSLGDHDTHCPECGGEARHVFVPLRFRFALKRRSRPMEHQDEVYSRMYQTGQRIGDPMFDEGFERVE